MKKIIALLLCLSMLFALAACKPANSTEPQDSGKAEPQNSSSAGSESEDINLSVILITGYEFYEQAIRDYEEKHPNVHVDVQVMDNTSIHDVIQTKLVNNDAPDIMPIYQKTNYVEYYKNGYLADLSDMTETISRLNAGAIDGFSVDGGVYGLPYVQEMVLAFYNKDMFAKYNLNVPTTYEELISVCETLKENGITPMSQGFKEAWVLTCLPQAWNASNVQADEPDFYKNGAAADGTNKFADSAGWLETLTMFQDFAGKYVNEGSLSTTSEQMYEMFVNQEVAMTVSGSWADGQISGLNPEFEVGGFPVPASGGNTGVLAPVAGGLGINAKCENMEAAKDLLAYMLSKESIETYGSFMIACFNDVESDLSPALLEAQALMSGIPGFTWEDSQFATGVSSVYYSGLQELIMGTMTPAEVLEDLDAATVKANDT